MSAPPTISVVSSLYNSGPYVSEFHSRIVATLRSLGVNYEIIFVNDGSPDDALQQAVDVQSGDPNVTVVDLSRNFGQHKATMTGMGYAGGDFVFVIEIDLEEQPEWLSMFFDELTSDEALDVVYGVQKTRKGGWFERVSGSLFYKSFNLFSDTKIPENHITVRLMTKRYVEALLAHRDRELFLGGVYELVGFDKKSLPVTKLSHSETTYSIRRKLVLFVNAITSFSTSPLAAIFWAGMLVSLFSLAIFVYVISKWMIGAILPGWTSLIASIWFVGGLLMLSISVIGIYLKKVLEEVKDRPYTVVKKVYKHSPGDYAEGA